MPLHGLRTAAQGWEIREQDAQRLAAARDFAGIEAFPFDHRLEVVAELSERELTLTTTLTATGTRPVPIAFGYHPYLQLPGVPRAEWEITLPVGDRLLLDERLVPTGERAPAGSLDGPLGERTFDDGFTLDELRGPFVLAGGGRRIEVRLRSRISLCTGVRAADRRHDLLRADDRAGGRAAARTAGRRAGRLVLGAVQRGRVHGDKRVRSAYERVKRGVPVRCLLTGESAQWGATPCRNATVLGLQQWVVGVCSRCISWSR